MGKRTRRIEIRLTEEEAEYIRKNAESYSSLGHYIRCAVSEYSNIGARERLDLINMLSQYYQSYQNQLSWAGSNLNQAVKRANELSIAGRLEESYIRKTLQPIISETLININNLKTELKKLTKEVINSNR